MSSGLSQTERALTFRCLGDTSFFSPDANTFRELEPGEEVRLSIQPKLEENHFLRPLRLVILQASPGLVVRSLMVHNWEVLGERDAASLIGQCIPLEHQDLLQAMCCVLTLRNNGAERARFRADVVFNARRFLGGYLRLWASGAAGTTRGSVRHFCPYPPAWRSWWIGWAESQIGISAGTLPGR